MVVYQVRAIGDESCGLRQTLFHLRARARKKRLRAGCAARKWRDAAHGNTSRRKRPPSVGGFQPQSQAERGTLVNLKFHVGGAVIRFRARDDDPRENFARREMIRVGADEELLDGDFASPSGTLDPDSCAEHEQHRGGIGVRLGEAKVASQRPGRSHSNIGHLRFEFRECGLLFPHKRGTFNRAMRAGRANFDYAITRLDRV